MIHHGYCLRLTQNSITSTVPWAAFLWKRCWQSHSTGRFINRGSLAKANKNLIYKYFTNFHEAFFGQQICSFFLASSFSHNLVGGFKPSETYSSNWIISPSSGEHERYLKPPSNVPLHMSDFHFETHHFAPDVLNGSMVGIFQAFPLGAKSLFSVACAVCFRDLAEK